MKSEHLHEIWSSPDNTRLTTKQFSFRLPVHVAAKVATLCDMYPQKNRTQIVADLLTAALDQLEKSLPEALGELVEEHWQDDIAEQLGEKEERLYYLGGARGRFQRLANKHYLELEKELGNETPEPLFTNFIVTESSMKK